MWLHWGGEWAGRRQAGRQSGDKEFESDTHRLRTGTPVITGQRPREQSR